ncbi:uncharacterized protein LOC141631298 [Silene latifolia]|uniref:uncharacterized protein LOC141631298 n=1 Tax=Silene latifolia TaxID=37657 RepID=UPI003D76CCBB
MGSVLRTKDEGGLGIKDREIWNKAMVGRLVDWIAVNRDSIWVQWIHNNYLKGQDWMAYKPSMNSSWAKGELVQGSAGWVGDPKHQFMGWLVAHAALNTTSKLVGFGVDIEDTCCICALTEETPEHLFCQCEYSKRIVKEVNRMTSWSFPESGVVEWCVQRTGTKVQKGVQIALMLSLIYHVWHQRNKARNEKVMLCPERVAKHIVEEMRIRVRGRDKMQLRLDELEWLKNMHLLV